MNFRFANNCLFLLFFPEHLSPEMLIFVGVTVGIILTILFMTMIILYCVKAQACCCRLDSSSKHKPSDIERYVLAMKKKWERHAKKNLG